jgi:hypothetical protein
MDSKNVGNRPVFLVHRPAACNSKNSNFENSKTKKLSDKPGETVGLPFYIHQILVFEFWIENRLKTCQLTGQTDQLTGFYP